MKIYRTMIATVVTVAAIGLALSEPANATVVIGYSFDGSGLFPLSAGPTTASYDGSFAIFTTNLTGSAAGPLPSILESLTLNVLSSGSPGVLNILITDTDVSNPVGTPETFNSGFTSNELTPGWIVQEQTFLDSGDGYFGMTTPLGNATFNTIGTNVQLDSADTGEGPYSVTEQYTIIAPIAGASLATIDLSSVSAVPEPATWAMFLVGFGGIGFMMRRSLRKIAVPFA
jgi:hypothetical protein